MKRRAPWLAVYFSLGLLLVGCGDSLDATPASSPAGLSFGYAEDLLPFTLSDGGEERLGLDTVEENVSWLEIAARDVDDEGFGEWVAAVSRTGLDRGHYRTSIDVRSNGVRTLIPVTLSVGVEVSGTISSSPSTFTDSDVNDTFTTPVSNDTPASAQAIPVPAIVGGFVNQPFAGSPGHSFSQGDPVDVYAIEMSAGHTVTLTLGGDPGLVDLDLRLLDDNLDEVADSMGTGSQEVVTAPVDGTYFVEVYPWSGCACASTYVLSVGQPAPASAWRQILRSTDDFVPDEVLVRLTPDAVRTAGAARAYRTATAGAGPTALGLPVLAGARDRTLRLSIADDVQLAALLTAGGVDPLQTRSAPAYQKAGAAGQLELDTIAAIKALRRHPDVLSADPNYIMRPQFTPDDPYFDLQWHYALANLPLAWDITRGAGSIVAVVDTGVLLGHPDLAGQLVPGYDFILDPVRAGDGGGIDSNPDDPGDGVLGQRSSFHGTHVAGTVAAATNNGIGVAGVAGDAGIMPVRVLGRNGGTLYDVMQGVRFAAGLVNDSQTTPANPADVINMSLSGGSFSASAQAVFDAVRAAGVIVVAAAGNEGSTALAYPASYDGVVSVSAVDMNKNLAPYSNRGTRIDVAAPGGDITRDNNGDGFADGVLSTLGDDSAGLSFGYQFYQGTSMAAPHVAGIVALMKAAAPTLTPAQLDALLDGSQGAGITEDLGAPGRDDSFGHGLIDARRAVAAAGPPPPPVPTLRSSPTALSFGSVITQLNVDLSDGGGGDPGDVTIVSVTDDQSWLDVVPDPSVDAFGLGTYSVTVDRTGLVDGTYSGTITAVSSRNTVLIPVVMTEGVVQTANAGIQVILLVDPITLGTLRSVLVNPVGSQYFYRIDNVEPGEYLVVGGTDLDNDDFLCHGGEACGGYPTVDALSTLRVGDDDVTDLDFDTGFQAQIGTAAAAAGGVPLPARGLRRPPDSVLEAQRATHP